MNITIPFMELDKNLIMSLGITDEEIQRELDSAMGGKDATTSLEEAVQDRASQFQVGNVLKGMIVNVVANDVFIEVGLKSEGIVELAEFAGGGAVEPGQEVEVLLEAVESASGLVVLSMGKA